MEKVRHAFELIEQDKWDELNNYLKKHDDIDVNIRDDNGNYILTYAIIQNRKDSVPIIINKGAKLDITDSDGRSILYTPIKYNYKDLFNLIINFNKTTLGVSLVNIADRNRSIPLHYAIKFKNVNFIKTLLANDSDPNFKDMNGNTAMHLSMFTKNVDIVKSILDSERAILDIQNKDGETPLHIAVNNQHLESIQLILKMGADTNIKDFEHEFTPLHYSTNLNSIEITKLLVENDANINEQDIYGNAPIHYVIKNGNQSIFGYFMDSDLTKDKININLFNYENKLPIHIALSKSEFFFQKLLEGSNLNFQNNDNITPLHMIVEKDYWKKYKEPLSKKKLNVFIQNSEGKTPYDLVGEDDKGEFMDLVVKSYIYILRTSGNIWSDKWDNVCKNELFANTLSKNDLQEIKKRIKVDQQTDLCYPLIKDKLEKMVKTGITCKNRSYPVKKSKTCIELKSGREVEICTFTGMMLDILIGLIYLLRKHNNSCSVIDTELGVNQELCNYYQKIGISEESCKLTNFEIVWINRKLFLSKNFNDNIKKCVNNKKRFVIIPLGIEMEEGNHANYIIYDIKKKEVERYEPYGSSPPYQFNYHDTLLDNRLEFRFTQIDKNIKYFRPKDYQPKVGLQFLESLENKTRKIGDPGGFCALWTIWYTDMRIKYRDVDRKSLINRILKSAKQESISMKNLIRNYSSEIIEIRDNIFSKVGININDWINDQYTTEQFEQILKHINDIINKL